MTKVNIAIVAHCIYEQTVVHHWMHTVTDKLPPLPYTMAATVVNNDAGQRIAQACVIIRTDTAADKIDMKNIEKLVASIEDIRKIVSQPNHSVLLVNFKLRDSSVTPSEEECQSVFARQYVEHTILGRA